MPPARLDEDHSVHSVGNVLCHHRGRAVIDEKARMEGLEGEHGRPRRGVRHDGPASGPCHGMEVHRVGHGAGGVVREMHLHGVAKANAEERPRHLPVEGPVCEGRPRGKEPDHSRASRLILTVVGARRPIRPGRSAPGHRQMSATASAGAAPGAAADVWVPTRTSRRRTRSTAAAQGSLRARRPAPLPRRSPPAVPPFPPADDREHRRNTQSCLPCPPGT